MLYSKESTRVDKSLTPTLAAYYYDNICVVCGDAFKSSRPRRKYCSQRCVNDAYIAWRRKKSDRKRAKAKACIVCSAPLSQGEGRIKSYCSKACRQKAYRVRKSEQSCH